MRFGGSTTNLIMLQIPFSKTMDFSKKRFRIKGVSIETVDKWLHQSENGQSRINLLIKMEKGYLGKVDIAEFQRIDSSINSDDGIYIKFALDEYFKIHGYPFKAHHKRKENPSSLYIEKLKPLLYCPIHNVPLKTESIFKEHQKCSYKSTTKKIERPSNIVIRDKNRETEVKLRKRKEDEHKAKDRTR